MTLGYHIFSGCHASTVRLYGTVHANIIYGVLFSGENLSPSAHLLPCSEPAQKIILRDETLLARLWLGNAVLGHAHVLQQLAQLVLRRLQGEFLWLELCQEIGHILHRQSAPALGPLGKSLGILALVCRLNAR